MSDSTLSAVAAKLDEVARELHEVRVWIVGNGEPGIFGSLRDLARDAHVHERNGGRGWNWRRLSYDIARQAATVLVLVVGGWAFGAFVLQLRVSLGAQ